MLFRCKLTTAETAPSSSARAPALFLSATARAAPSRLREDKSGSGTLQTPRCPPLKSLYLDPPRP
eukprot:scaffold34354_cov172-Isochrysis_galbana.AAC.1